MHDKHPIQTILIVGNGGREHALAWKISQSPEVQKIFVAPGNGGTCLENKTSNVPIPADDVSALLAFAKHNQIDLTIIGPEAPLAAGIVDVFSKEGLRCFGPTRAAARLESSKAFCKQFMRDHDIPTAPYIIFSDLTHALSYLESCTFPLVIKADGLASGKGVIIAKNKLEATEALHDMLGNHRFGDASSQVVIEAFLEGEEASFIVIADGEFALPLATSQDHKTRDNGDKGPNTGGMGAYSPAPVVSSEIQKKVMETIIYPALKGLAAQGSPYTGFLYAGIMITSTGEPTVLEFNCRLGDPETQPILMRLKSDLTELCMAALEKRLHNITLTWDERPALGVVMASKGYPDSYRKGDVIHLPNQDTPNCKVFQAGTVSENSFIRTAGGRVLCVTALGKTIEDAQKEAYSVVKTISWGEEFYRTDIGDKAV